MRALIDADMPANELGGIIDEETKEALPWEDVEPLAKGRFFSIFIQSEAGGFKAYLSKGPTFRDKLATIVGYKANRDPAKRPFHALRIKEYYHDTFGAEYCDGIEADDAMAMEQWRDWLDLAEQSGFNEEYIKSRAHTVICSRDKDLDTVPGWHFRWTLKREKDKKIALGEVAVDRPPYYVTLIQATRNFYKQLLMGDPVDNIKGLWKVGKKSDWVKQLDDMHSEAEMYEHVKDKYVKHYNNYWELFLKETARLLHMLRHPKDVWMPPCERDDTYYVIPHREV